MRGSRKKASIGVRSSRLRAQEKAAAAVEKYVWSARPMPYYSAWQTGSQSAKQNGWLYTATVNAGDFDCIERAF